MPAFISLIPWARAFCRLLIASTRWCKAAALRALWSEVVWILRLEEAEGEEMVDVVAARNADSWGLQARSEAARASMEWSRKSYCHLSASALLY